MRTAFLSAVLLLVLHGYPLFAAEENLGELSLDALLEMDVVTVAKTPEKLIKTPAAIYVITQEDMRRSGVNSIPEALRMVPGMHVYRIDANRWAISARGFASHFANKMLVMIDGRTVYTPLFSGVYWDVQDTMLADIERIEVIRGPGGSLWGTNAVNGIINIITKDSADTQGALIHARTGDDETGTIEARYGDWLGERTSYRVYGKFYDRDEYQFSSGESAGDDYDNNRGGFRVDTNLAGGDKFTLQGEIYSGNSREISRHVLLEAPYGYEIDSTSDISGRHIISRWNKILSDTSSFNIQFYYDRTERKDHYLEDEQDIFDIDFQHQFRIGGSHDILWGVGHRYIDSQVEAQIDPLSGLYTYRLDPPDHEFKLFTGFLQDRISLAGGRGELTLGAKLEYNEFTDFEWQPSLRLLWSINEKSTVWGAASRTVRTPSLAELSGEANAAGFPVFMPGAPGTPPVETTMLLRLIANDDIDEERTYSYELGYRHQFGDHLFFDVAAFYNQYKGIIGAKVARAPFAETFPPAYVVMELYPDNAAEVDSYGVEISCSWAIFDWWKVTGGLTWFDMDRDNKGSLNGSFGFGEGEQAEYQLSLISYVDLSRHFEINGAYYYTNSYSFETDHSDASIDAYHRLDVNIVWKPTDHLRISVGGLNLLDNYHAEFYSDMDGLRATEIPRSLYASLEWSF